MVKKQKIILVILFLLFLIGLNVVGGNQVRNSFYFMASPFSGFFRGIGKASSDFFVTLINSRSLKLENERLISSNQNLLQENAEFHSLKKENEVLRKVLKLGLNKKFNLQMASVLSLDLREDFVVLNKGKADGIKENMPVITQEKVLVGKVIKVFPNFSQVELISNPQSKFSVKFLSTTSSQEKNFYAAAQGNGHEQIILLSVPQEKKIKKGEVVVSYQLGNIFPKDLLVGKVSQIKKNDLKPFQAIDIEPFFKNNLPDILFIIKNS